MRHHPNDSTHSVKQKNSRNLKVATEPQLTLPSLSPPPKQRNQTDHTNSNSLSYGRLITSNFWQPLPQPPTPSPHPTQQRHSHSAQSALPLSQPRDSQQITPSVNSIILLPTNQGPGVAPYAMILPLHLQKPHAPIYRLYNASNGNRYGPYLGQYTPFLYYAIVENHLQLTPLPPSVGIELQKQSNLPNSNPHYNPSFTAQQNYSHTRALVAYLSKKNRDYILLNNNRNNRRKRLLSQTDTGNLGSPNHPSKRRKFPAP